MPLGCGDEEGGGGGVAVALDIAEETGFGIGDLECGGDFADEVYVGLMHEEDADVGGLELIAGEEVFDGAGDFAGCLNDDVEALLPIRTSGSRPPLYCVHPISGSAYPYAAIGQLLDSDQPVYGFESPGFEDGRTPLTSLEALSAEYVEVLGDVAPGGPYFLLGWSMGGAIAFDMAQRLSASGASVPLLVLIDTAVPAKMELPAQKAMLHRFVVDMIGVSGTSPAGLDLDGGSVPLPPVGRTSRVSSRSSGKPVPITPITVRSSP